MATKKSAKSSKTAHVLNVLSHPQGEDYPGESAPDLPLSQDGPISDTAPSEPHAQPLLPPILEDARSYDESVSGQIMDALSQELGLDAEVAELPKEPVQEAPIPEAPIQEVPVSETPAPAEPAPAPPVESPPAESLAKPAAVEAPTLRTPRLHEQLSHISVAELPDDLVYVNVMQALVEEKAPKYIKMFGLCTCSRCMADVKALALTNLPPKYAVMHSGECIPMLTVYEGRYSSALIAQILAACKQVMDSPRHPM